VGPRTVPNLVIGLILGASAFFTLTEKLFWPFAPYDMYSTSNRELHTQYYLEGESPSGRRFSLSSGRYLHPFNNRELVFKIFPPLLAERAKLHQKMLLFQRHYTERRRRNLHNGPALQRVRLYRVSWKLDENAANLLRPTRKTLLHEVP
jgi:hypothetical protein